MLHGGCFCGSIRYEADAVALNRDELPLLHLPAHHRRTLCRLVQRPAP